MVLKGGKGVVTSLLTDDSEDAINDKEGEEEIYQHDNKHMHIKKEGDSKVKVKSEGDAAADRTKSHKQHTLIPKVVSKKKPHRGGKRKDDDFLSLMKQYTVSDAQNEKRRLELRERELELQREQNQFQREQ